VLAWMHMINFLQTYPYYYLCVAFLFGISIGSFLNVLIYRLPLMLQKEWQTQSMEVLGLPDAANESDITPFNLCVPRSHCPHCRKTIPFHRNLPILSFLLQRGKCFSCKAKISWRYPLVEWLAGLLAVLCVWHFGVTWQTPMAMIFCFTLLSLCFIDLESFLLPDNLTLFLLWVGLLLSVFPLFIPSHAAILGATLGYLTLWGIAKIFYFFTRVEGMGYGDFKLAAALGAWLGWQFIPLLISLAAILALLIGGAFMLRKKLALRAPIPFGPFLSLSGLVLLFWGQAMMTAYTGLLC